MELKELTLALSNQAFIGSVNTLTPIIEQYLGVKLNKDVSNNFTAFKDFNANKTILLEAHLDEVGFVITHIDGGFLTVNSVGSIDAKFLPGQRVTFFGKDKVPGVFCSTPPHLKNGEKESFEIENLKIDTGLKDASLFLSVGDFGVFDTSSSLLINDLITAKSLDNRAGVAAVLYAFKNIKKSCYNIKLLLSSGEEVGLRGAITGAYKNNCDSAICVDVSFADTYGVKKYKTKPLSSGAMVGISPILNRDMSNKLLSLSKNATTEIMGGKTGTNADVISCSKEGVKTALISIPLKNMHTPVEIVDVCDIKATADLIIKYLECEN